MGGIICSGPRKTIKEQSSVNVTKTYRRAYSAPNVGIFDSDSDMEFSDNSLYYDSE